MAADNIIINLLLLTNYGVIVGAWTTLAAFSIGALVSWMIGKFVFLLPALESVFGQSALAIATTGGVINSIPLSSGITWLFAKISFGFFTYAVMAFALDIADFPSC